MQLTAALIALAFSAPLYAAPLESRTGSNSINYVDEPKSFTSAFHTRAVNTTVINNSGVAVAGQSGAFGQYALRINSDKGIICWDITTVGVTGDFMSPAVTAIHIHQASAGSAGPPRIAFPNPEFTGTNAMGAEVRKSKGCQKKPFITGVRANNGTGPDNGSESGFELKQIEQDPSAFFGDTHTQAFPAGAIRGQLLPSEREVKKPSYFTSTLRTEATGDQIISTMTNASVAGAKKGKGYYSLRLNTDKDILCYDIVLTGKDISTDYTSPAKTATHTHQAIFGRNGPPRLAFENPKKTHTKISKLLSTITWGKIDKSSRRSQKCVVGPFTTGLIDASTGLDSGSASGFTLSALQENPTGFFSDVHTTQFSQGAVRGQMYKP